MNAPLTRTWPIELEVELSQVLAETPDCFPDLEPRVVCNACRARHLLASDWWREQTATTEGTST